jgi:hypothetical protein
MKEKMLDELQKLAEEIGRTPTCQILNNSRTQSAVSYSNYFGSVNNALVEAGLERNVNRSITEKDLLDEIDRLAEELDRTPSATDMGEHGRYSDPTYSDRFGSWAKALKEAGYEPRQPRKVEDDDEQLIAELERVAEEHKTNPTQQLVQKHAKYAVNTYIGRFGSWSAAKKAAGYEPIARKDITDTDLLDEIRHLADELGRAPFSTEMKNNGRFSCWIYVERFGSWKRAVSEAGLEASELAGKNHPNWKGGYEPYYGPNWYEQRRRALERDDYSCQACGVTKQELGQNPDVHHITPFREFVDDDGNADYEAANDLDNLMAVCRSCHAEIENSDGELSIAN